MTGYLWRISMDFCTEQLTQFTYVHINTHLYEDTYVQSVLKRKRIFCEHNCSRKNEIPLFWNLSWEECILDKKKSARGTWKILTGFLLLKKRFLLCKNRTRTILLWNFWGADDTWWIDVSQFFSAYHHHDQSAMILQWCRHRHVGIAHKTPGTT